MLPKRSCVLYNSFHITAKIFPCLVATFVSNFTASGHCGSVFVDDNKSVLLSVLLYVHLPPICSSSCDVLCGAPSFHPQPRSAGKQRDARLGLKSSTVSLRRSNRARSENQFAFIFGCHVRAEEEECAARLSVSSWSASQRCWSGCNSKTTP